MKIEFKGKVKQMRYMDGSLASERIKVPTLSSNHVNMNEARSHSKYGMYANSDMFSAILAKIGKNKFPKGYVDINDIPENVTVNTDGFLAIVSWNA